MESEQTEIVYFVRYFDPVRKKRVTTSYKLTEAEARSRYGVYELVLPSRETRKIGGDCMRDSAAHFHTGSPDKR